MEKFSKDDAIKNDEIINKARHSVEEMKLQNIEKFTEFQKYLIDQVTLQLSVLKQSLRTTYFD